MAYSRWNDSRWFVFGCTKEDAPLEKQELAVHDREGWITHYTFSELKENVERVLNEVQSNTGASEAEMYELKGYFITFLREAQFGLPRARQMEKVDYFCEKHELLPFTEFKSLFIDDKETSLQLDYPIDVPNIEIVLWAKGTGSLFFIGKMKEGEYADDCAILGVAMELTANHYHSTIIHWVYKQAVAALLPGEDLKSAP